MSCKPITANIERLARIAANTTRLRRLPNTAKRLAFVIFGFPPASGSVGSAAHLDVWASLHRILLRLRQEGYTVPTPETPEDLLDLVLTSAGGGARSGAAVAARYPVRAYLDQTGDQARRIAPSWGAPPGDVDTDGRNLLIHGVLLGNVYIGVQPSFGYDDDPMALLFRPEATPSHSFAGFYAWMRNEFQPDAMIHVGTHGALEFMPGKQTALAPSDWPGLLSDDFPHYYLYCINDPSEGSIAKRRANATLISHLTPPLDEAGVYGSLAALAEEVRQARAALAAGEEMRARLAAVAAAAEEAHLAFPDHADPGDSLAALQRQVEEVSATLIPIGLHVLGTGIATEEARVTLKAAAAHARPNAGLPALVEELERLHTGGRPLRELPPDDPGRAAAEAELDAILTAALRDGPAPQTGLPPAVVEGWLRFLSDLRRRLDGNDELGALLHALDGRYLKPSPGGEPSRHEAALPTGRNLHALDPQRVPTPAALARGRALADALLQASIERTGRVPETVALVLWGVDNVKNGGEAIAQLLALIGAEPLPDPSGRVDRFRLVPLEELGRPRVDVVATMSGIFRDLFPTTIALLDRVVRAAAAAEEPDELNHLRAHARAQATMLGIPPSEAATRLWSAAPGQYGAGVNHVVHAGQWDQEADLADVFTRRMGHAWGARLTGAAQERLLRASLATATVTFQNIDSAETSLGDVDHYFEYLGGLTAAVTRETGRRPETLVADSHAARPTVRTLADAMVLESRTRLLNPRWYEAQLAHGYQGVGAVMRRLANTFGMQATTGSVPGWVFTDTARTFLFDDALRQRLEEENPQALQALAERLAEAPRPRPLGALARGLRSARRAHRPARRPHRGRGMTEPMFPFTAVLGQDELKSCLLLNASTPASAACLPWATAAPGSPPPCARWASSCNTAASPRRSSTCRSAPPRTGCSGRSTSMPPWLRASGALHPGCWPTRTTASFTSMRSTSSTTTSSTCCSTSPPAASTASNATASATPIRHASSSSAQKPRGGRAPATARRQVRPRHDRHHDHRRRTAHRDRPPAPGVRRLSGTVHRRARRGRGRAGRNRRHGARRPRTGRAARHRP